MKRPVGVLRMAQWNEQDHEWVQVYRDSQGRRQGPGAYWRADGSICCLSNYVDDKPHGYGIRYHENGEISRVCPFENGKLHGVDTAYRSSAATTEGFPLRRASEAVRACQLYWDQGTRYLEICLDKDGRQIQASGEDLPSRPRGVPDDAIFQEGVNMGGWYAGELKRKDGTLTAWTINGHLVEKTEYKDGKQIDYKYFPESGMIEELKAQAEAEKVDEAPAVQRKFEFAVETFTTEMPKGIEVPEMQIKASIEEINKRLRTYFTQLQALREDMLNRLQNGETAFGKDHLISDFSAFVDPAEVENEKEQIQPEAFSVRDLFKSARLLWEHVRRLCIECGLTNFGYVDQIKAPNFAQNALRMACILHRVEDDMNRQESPLPQVHFAKRELNTWSDFVFRDFIASEAHANRRAIVFLSKDECYPEVSGVMKLYQ